MRGCVTRIPDFNREEEEESGDKEKGVGVGVGGRMRGEGRVRYHDLYDGRHRRHNGHKGRREGSRGKRRNKGDGRRRGNQEEEDDDDADEDDVEEDDDEGSEDEDDKVDGDDDEASTSDPALALAPALPPLLAFGRLESMLVTPRIQQCLLREAQSLASSKGDKGYYRLPARVFTSSTLAQEANEVNPSSLAVPQTSSSATATTTAAATTATSPSGSGAVKNIRQLQMMLIKHMLQPSTIKHTTSQETQVRSPINT